MALVVEDGTGLSNADSYCSLEFADEFLANIGVTSWESKDESDSKEPALRNATRYLKQKYRTLWAGTRATSSQALDWPRYDVPMIDGPGYADGIVASYPPNVIPDEIKQACALLAVRVANGDSLNPDTTAPILEETVGPITTKYAKEKQTNRYAEIDDLLRPFLKTGGAYVFPIVRN